MQHDGTIENPPVRGPLYIHAKEPREQLPQNNHKHESMKKESNKSKDKYKKTGPPQAKIPHPRPNANSVQFEDPYGHINHMKNHHENSTY